MFGRKIYTAIERGEAKIPLHEVTTNGNLDLYEDVISKGYFYFYLKKDQLKLVAGNHVGLIPLNSKVALNIEPKIAKNNFFHIVGKSQNSLKELAYLRSYLRSEFTTRPLTEFLARTLILQMNSILENGLYRQYQPQQELTSFPKGRLLFTESIRQAWCYGRYKSLVINSYHFSKDIPHNRLLKYALHLAIKYLNLSNQGIEISKQMVELEDLFSAIPLDPTLKYLSDVIVSLENNSIPEIRDYYNDVCRTALLIAENTGLVPNFSGSEVTLSFVINMETVFENYCFYVLYEKSQNYDVTKVVQGKNEKIKLFSGLNCDPREAAPDIIIENSLGQRLTLEVKYKNKPDRNDINQAVIYALVCNINITVILCFSEEESKSGWEYMGMVGSSVHVWIYRIYLENQDIESEEEKFVANMSKMLHEKIVI